MKKNNGFTLFEILIALFIFTIISLLITSALQSVIAAHTQTEINAERWRALQKSFLVLSRDLEQAINRPVQNNFGRMEGAFVGESQSMSFTHSGFASSDSHLQRVQYIFRNDKMTRTVWRVLDQASDSLSYNRDFIKNISDLQFEYLDGSGKFYEKWPSGTGKHQALPRAVRVRFTIKHWGQISQLYVLPI